jgi:hypothetical protein
MIERETIRETRQAEKKIKSKKKKQKKKKKKNFKIKKVTVIAISNPCRDATFRYAPVDKKEKKKKNTVPIEPSIWMEGERRRKKCRYMDRRSKKGSSALQG